MKRLLDEAKWMDGAVWTLLMFTVFATVEILLLGAQANAGFWTRQFVVWGLAGAGYAVLSGWLERRRTERDAALAAAGDIAVTEEAVLEPEPEPEPEGDRAERRRAARQARKKEKQGR